MGARLSRRRDGVIPPRQTGVGASSSSDAGRAGDSARYTSGLSSYAAACKADPAVQSFDSTLQARTSRALSSLATGVEVRSLSVDSLKEVTGCLLDMNQEVVKVILLCKKDVWKSPQLFDLVEEYFENSLQTLDFCASLEKCLRRARDSQMMLHVALRRFDEEEEEEEKDGCRKNKYARTLAELRGFAANGNPFTAEFFAVLRSVHAQQLRLLEKLQLRKGKLDEKLRGVRTWRRLSCIIFAAAFAAILICSVVAAAVAAPPVAAAVASATSVPVGSMGRWFDSLLKGYHDELKGRKELVGAMQVGAFVAVKDLDGIRVLAERLESQVDSLLRAAEFAGRGEGDDAHAAAGLAVGEISRELAAFAKSIDDLGDQADRCGRDIRRARTVVLQRIIKHPH